MPFVLLAHAINVVVLALVLRGLWADSATMAAAYGPDGPARRILACVYGAILFMSLAALVYAAVTRLAAPVPFLWVSFALFAVQIVYKLATAFVANPVVAANLLIVATHGVACVALVLALRA